MVWERTIKLRRFCCLCYKEKIMSQVLSQFRSIFTDVSEMTNHPFDIQMMGMFVFITLYLVFKTIQWL